MFDNLPPFTNCYSTGIPCVENPEFNASGILSNPDIPMKLSSARKHTMKRAAAAVFTILLVPQVILSNPASYNWGMRKEDVMTKLISNAEHTAFTPSAKPEYENKILNFILAINSDMKERITILRTGTVPPRDFLLINNKLYSVLENYGVMPAASLDKVIQELTTAYKQPNIQKDKNMVTYSFYGKDTKVLVLSYQKQNLVDCKVYHYASKLFRILISE